MSRSGWEAAGSVRWRYTSRSGHLHVWGPWHHGQRHVFHPLLPCLPPRAPEDLQGWDHASPGRQGHHGVVGSRVENIAMCNASQRHNSCFCVSFRPSRFCLEYWWLTRRVCLILREDLTKIPYTTMCIKESLRLYPPVPGMSRKTTKPMTFFDGRTLPEGLLFLGGFFVHVDETARCCTLDEFCCTGKR